MLFLRSLVFNVLFILNNAVWFILSLPMLLAPYRFFIDRVAHPWARSNLWLFYRVIGVTLDVRGQEHLPAQGTGALVAAKHQSAWETLFLAQAVDGPTYILKRELMFVPLFGFYLKKVRSVPINRGKGSAVLADMNSAAKEAIAQGRQLLIFPEGTRRAVGAEPHYKYGIAHLYRETGVACTPIAHNAGLFWPRRGFVKRPGHLIVEILPPIPAGLDRDTFFARVQHDIETATNRIVAEARMKAAP
jgi:1-acyl-sn-glycerol-3-phosphate acyltransferase